MRTLFFSGLVAAGLVAAAAAFAPAQDEEEFEFDDIDDSAWTDFLPPTKEQEKRNAEMAELLQGAWQLVEFETDALNEYRRHDRGVAVFSQGFFSIEMHVQFESLEPYPEQPGPVFFQSGSFRYRLNDTGDLVAKIIIGASSGGVIPGLRFERPGSVRVFELEVEKNRLELRRSPGNFRYEFIRLRNGAEEQLDVFGRPAVDDDEFKVEGFEPPDLDDPIDDEDELDDDDDRSGRRGRRDRRNGDE